MMRTKLLVTNVLGAVSLALCAAGLACAGDGLPRTLPVEPPRAPATMRVLEGFRLELIAAEPLVTDPVAMVYDENGLAYVVEMRDYPYVGKANDKPWEDQPSPPLGEVRVLEDTDGDGRFDRSTLFADKLSWPTGIALWKGGVFVTATPDIWYLKDTDGDQRADVREKVFTGFRKYNIQAVINNLQWGLDHRIYGAGSSNGGTIRAGDNGRGKTVTLGRNDFRFDPAARQLELLSGGARFGNTFDDYGNRFICNIRNPVQHIVLDDRYLARNPTLPVRSAVEDAAEAGDAIPVFRISPPESWRVMNANRLQAENRAGTPKSEMTATGYVTSSAGVTVYRGAAYPEDFYGNVFVGEVAGNLVIRYRLEPRGATFGAVRAHQHEEFLASTDNWFRPVNFVNAPDGTLHLLDMYRETIEHPWSIPDDIKAMLDLESGRDRGRIYRLVPPKYRAGFAPPPRPKLGSAATSELVAQLENRNSWWRDTAHRLLYERQDKGAIEPLRNVLKTSTFAPGRLHALYSLQGLGALEPEDLRRALDDASPRLREHGVRLAEARLRGDEALRLRVVKLAGDGDARVRLQVALSLGEVPGPDSTKALRAIARRDVDDPWIRTAVLCSMPAGAAAPWLREAIADRSFASSAGGRELAQQLSLIVAARRQNDELTSVLAALLQQPSFLQAEGVAFDSPAFGLFLTICERLRAGGRSLDDLLPAESAGLTQKLERSLAAAASAAASAKTPEPERLLAIRLLACRRFDSVYDVLARLVDVQQPQEVQLAAASALAGSREPRVTDLFLQRYGQFTPAVRDRVIVLLLARTERTRRLLDAIEKGAVPAADVPPVRREILMHSDDAALRSQAAKLFATRATPAERQQTLKRYREALAQSAPADLARGAAVFKRECATCHRLANEGNDAGPNLATISGRTPPEVLEHVLDPNREVSPQYLEYAVATRDGLIKTGVIAAETATSITLRQANGAQETVLRSDIETMKSSGKSLMPEGLEQKVTPDEMRDLIGFLLAGPKR